VKRVFVMSTNTKLQFESYLDERYSTSIKCYRCCLQKRKIKLPMAQVNRRTIRAHLNLEYYLER